MPHTIRPLIFLSRFPDTEIQRYAALAMAGLALGGQVGVTIVDTIILTNYTNNAYKYDTYTHTPLYGIGGQQNTHSRRGGYAVLGGSGEVS
jgi:lipid-binding SYLF domain-containing protein